MAADLANRGLGGAADQGEADEYRRLACETDLANQFCEDGEPVSDMKIEITVDETSISFAY